VTGLFVALPVLAVIAIVAVTLLEFVFLPRKKKRIIAQFDDIFEGLHDRELLVRDRAEDLRAMWEDVHPRARQVAEKRGLQSFAKMSRADRDVLNELIDDCIPKLRSQLYDALRNISIDAGQRSGEQSDVVEEPTVEEPKVEEILVEEQPVEDVAPPSRRFMSWGKRDTSKNT
jgi:hypothetical protein